MKLARRQSIARKQLPRNLINIAGRYLFTITLPPVNLTAHVAKAAPPSSSLEQHQSAQTQVENMEKACQTQKAT